MLTEEEQDPAQNYTSMPDIGVDRASRQLLIEGKGLLSRLEAILRENPEVSQFLDFEGGLNAYIGRLEPGEPAWLFSFNFYFYQLLFDCVFIQLGLAGMARQVIELNGLVIDGRHLLNDECIPAIRGVQTAVENESKASRDENSARLKAVEGAVNSFKTRVEVFLPLQTTVVTEAIAGLGLAIDGALTAQTVAVGEAVGLSTTKVVEAINELPDKIHDKFQEGIPATAETDASSGDAWHWRQFYLAGGPVSSLFTGYVPFNMSLI